MTMFKVIISLVCLIKYIAADVEGSLTLDLPSSAESLGAESGGRKNHSGYTYYPEIQGWLRLHTDPVDWYTARMYCHDEEAILAAPWNKKMKSVLQNIQSKAIYLGIQKLYPEGDYIYRNRKPVFSKDPIDVMSLNSCGAYYLNEGKGEVKFVDCQQPLTFVCYAPSRSVCGDNTPEYTLDERTGQCYKFHPVAKTWNDANAICLSESAHLAIINSDLEAKVLADLFAKYPPEKLNGTNPAWNVMAIGFSYWKEADEYRTIYGQTLQQAGYEKWGPGNPSSRGEMYELGGGMFRSGLLDDVGKYMFIPFACEKKPILSRVGY